MVEKRKFSEEKLNLIMEFFKEKRNISLTREEIIDKCTDAPEELSKDFIKVINSDISIKDYYCQEDYIFDLVAVSDWKLFKERIAFAIETTSKNKAKSIIDFGAGCGFACLAFAKKGFETTYVDYKGSTWDFAEWLFKREGVKVRMITSDDYFLEDEVYDVTYSNDVLEHVLHLGRTLIKFSESTKMACIMFYCFSQEGNFKQHIHLNPGAQNYLYNIFDMHGFHYHKVLPENLFVRKPHFGYFPEGLK